MKNRLDLWPTENCVTARHHEDEVLSSPTLRLRGGELTDTITPLATLQSPDSNRYVVIQKDYAVGGLGCIHTAIDRHLNRLVACKQIHERLLGDVPTRLRFWREAAVTAQLEHPNIVPVYDLGIGADGLPFYTMRLIQGTTLTQAIVRHHGLKNPEERLASARDLFARFCQVCNAVAYAHSQGVIHCDLKPDNILMGPFGETLVVDWGLAHLTSDSFRRQVDVAIPEVILDASSIDLQIDALGTPGYMSPEQRQAKAHHLGPLTDIYALGMTLLELAAGQRPTSDDIFEDSLYPERLERRKEDLFRTMPTSLAAICRKATATDPFLRYPSALTLARDVENYSADEDLIAVPESTFARFLRWCRHHRGLIQAILLAVGIVLIALLATYFLTGTPTVVEDKD